MNFREGDTVTYTGHESPFLAGKVGRVLKTSPRGGYRLLDVLSVWDTVPVEWDGVGYFGVYAKNVEHCHLKPEWEV